MEEFPRPEIVRSVETARDLLRELAPGDSYDAGVPAALVAARLHLLTVPGAFGGFGASLPEARWAQAELGAIDGSAALGLAMHTYLVGATAESGGWPDGLCRDLFETIRDEGALINAAATEERGGSPARGAIPETRAQAVPNGYRLSGEKTWTTWLPALRFALVTARMEDVDADSGGLIGAFLVDLRLPGVERLPAFEALGMRASASGRLRLSDVHVPADRLVFSRKARDRDPRGASPQAWFGMCLAATYLGVGEGARERVTDWAIDRGPGDGAIAVADMPSVRVRLGRIDAAIRTARIVLFDVARRWQSGPPARRASLMPDVALAKVVATNAAVAATDEALRIAGGPGFLAGPLERAFRDARAGLINPPLDDIAHQDFAKTLIERARADR
jgi:alkylation response protein AidB-like acyl-CoA dehydrogenase